MSSQGACSYPGRERTKRRAQLHSSSTYQVKKFAARKVEGSRNLSCQLLHSSCATYLPAERLTGKHARTRKGQFWRGSIPDASSDNSRSPFLHLLLLLFASLASRSTPLKSQSPKPQTSANSPVCCRPRTCHRGMWSAWRVLRPCRSCIKQAAGFRVYRA